MNLQVGDTLSLNFKIQSINIKDKTVVLIDTITKESIKVTFELLQNMDSIFTFKVT